MRKALKVWALTLSVLAIYAATVSTASAQAQTSDSISLNGTWLMHAGDLPAWSATAVDETTWQKVQEPGAQLAPGFSWLRLHFTVPAEWATDPPLMQMKTLELHLGAIHGAASVYLNSYFVYNKIGTVPTTAGGLGYEAAEATDDLVAQFPYAAPVKKDGPPVAFLNYGADNVIAIRVYDPNGGSNPAAGDLRLTKPTYADLYPVSTHTDHSDHLFTSDTPVQFDVIFGNATSDPAPLQWQIAINDESGAPVPGITVAPVNGTVHSGKDKTYNIPPIALPDAGVYHYVIHATANNQTLPDTTFAAGYNVGNIHLAEDPPADLSTFWSQVVSQANSKPPHADFAKYGDTSGITTYQIKYDGFDGRPTYAWLSVPDKLGPSPVEVIHLPGYENDPQQPDMTLAKHGYVVLDFIATAQNWTSGNADQHYMSEGVASQNTYIIRTIEGNVIRALGILRSYPQQGVTGTPKIVLWGESQGGGLALITAGLLKQEVAGVVAISPYFTDIPQIMDMVPKDNNPFLGYLDLNPGTSKSTVYKSLSYFDTIYFAPKITAPTFIAVGLEDQIAPPSSAFALGNKLGENHTTYIVPDAGHVPAASEQQALTWLAMKVK